MEVSRLTSITPCLCPGHEATYECSVDDGVTTTWQGTALQECRDGSIILRHSQFASGHNTNETCGTTGEVIGRSVSSNNNSFTSQLTLTISEKIFNKTIECAGNILSLSSESILLLL